MPRRPSQPIARRRRPVSRRSRAALVLLALLLLAAGSPAGASGAWSAPFDLSLPGDHRREAQVAVDPSGAAVAAWLASDAADTIVQARRIDANGTVGPILDLSPAGRIAASPDVGIDAAGNATVVWSDRAQTGIDEIVRARRITAGGALEATIDLTSAGLASKLPNVEVAPSGAATVVWRAAPGIVRMRRIDQVGGPGATLDMSASGGQHDVALGANGDAYVVWAEVDGADQLIQMRRADAGGGLGPVVTLSDDSQLSFSPLVQVDAAGLPTVAWIKGLDSIALRRLQPGGTLGATAVVAPAGAAVAHTIGDLAVDLAGNATVVWAGQSGANQAVFLRRVSAAGTLGPISELWSGGDDGDPRLTVDGAGAPTLIWPHVSGAGASTIRTRTAPLGGPLGPIADLRPATTDAGFTHPAIAANAAGELTAVWQRLNLSTHEQTIVAARSTLPPAPAPPPAPTGPPPAPGAPSCGTVALGMLKPYTARQAKRRRTKGVGARLSLARAGRLDLISATLRYRLAGRRRTAKLRTRDVTARSRAILRFKLPARLARRLEVGQRVTLRLRLRAGASAAGCPFGKAKTLSVRTRLIWVPKRATR